MIQAGTTAKLFTSYNIASFTDNGAGDFTLSFTVPFASASEYAVVASSFYGADTRSTAYTSQTTQPTATTINILTLSAGGGGVDNDPTTVLCVGRR